MKSFSRSFILSCFCAILFVGCALGEDTSLAKKDMNLTQDQIRENGYQVSTLGAGCFWCVEAVYARLDGVKQVTSGYMGGTTETANYSSVCAGTTDHAEVVQIVFDPKVLSYSALLEWFWRLHDPTTLNRQGADVGRQYRSVVFYSSEEHRLTALEVKKLAQENFKQPIVTEISPATIFYSAEKYHQDYYENNKSQGYCQFVIRPKLKKLNLE